MIKEVKNRMWLAIMVVTGFIMRILSCFWGFPYLLHPDEEYIVERTVEMLGRKSWEADVYEWPGHFLIKIDAVLFWIISKLRYHEMVVDAFENHRILFYYAARSVTCIFGAAMIVLAYLIAERIKEGMGKWASIIFAFYPVFIKHSAYATTDIPLSALFLLMMYLSMRYIEKPSDGLFITICGLVGASMSTKYPGTVFVAFPVYLAFREGILKKDALFIVKKAFQAAVSILLALILLAPNLVTNLNQVVAHVLGEADYEIAGSINYGFWGNVLFYLTNMAQRGGIVLIALAAAGIVWCFIKKSPQIKILIVGFCYMLFICSLNLQLERWGMPVYSIFLMLAMAGVSGITELLKDKAAIWKYGKPVLNILLVLFCVNCVTGGIRQTVANVVKENRVRAMDYCQANGISEENAYFDGYTPFAMDAFFRIKYPVDDDRGIVFTEKSRRYYIISDQTYARFFVEPVSEESKQNQKRYLEIWDKCKLVKEWREYDKNSSISAVNAFYNVVETGKFITGGASGATISIYEKP